MEYGIVYGVVNFKDLIEKYPVVNKDWCLNFFDIGGLSNRICNLYSYSGHNAPHEWTLDHHKYNDSVKCWFERTIINYKEKIIFPQHTNDHLNKDPWNRDIPLYGLFVDHCYTFNDITHKPVRLLISPAGSNVVMSLGKLYSSSVEGMKIYLLDIYEN